MPEATPARAALRAHLESGLWKPCGRGQADAWELRPDPGAPEHLLIVLWPRNTRLGAFGGPLEFSSRSAQFSEGTPAEVIVAAVEAAEREMGNGG